LPDVFDPIFLNRLQGVGPKIRNLVAEAGYGTIAGPHNSVTVPPKIPPVRRTSLRQL
jgi:hypothetical protein